MFLQRKQPEELELLLKVITDNMETAASAADLRTAREGLFHSMERLREGLAVPAPTNGCFESGKTEITMNKPGVD